MIVPLTETTVLRIYYCPLCKGTFRENSRKFRCGVDHAPGSCCHHFDQPVSKETLDRIWAAFE